MAADPGHRQAGRIITVLLSKSGELLGHLIILRRAVADLVHFVLGQATAVRASLPAIFAGQQPSAERAVGNDPQIFRGGQGQQLDLGLAFDQVVHRL